MGGSGRQGAPRGGAAASIVALPTRPPTPPPTHLSSHMYRHARGLAHRHRRLAGADHGDGASWHRRLVAVDVVPHAMPVFEWCVGAHLHGHRRAGLGEGSERWIFRSSSKPQVGYGQCLSDARSLSLSCSNKEAGVGGRAASSKGAPQFPEVARAPGSPPPEAHRRPGPAGSRLGRGQGTPASCRKRNE